MLLKSTTADKLRTVRLRPSYIFINLMILAVDHRLHEIMILSTTDFVKLSWRLSSNLNYILTTPSSCSRTWVVVSARSRLAFFRNRGWLLALFSLFFLRYFDINIHYLCHFFHVKYINNLFKVLSKFKRTLNFIFSL